MSPFMGMPGMDLSSVLADPRTPPGMRAAAIAAMQRQQPQQAPAQMPPQMPAAAPTAPSPASSVMAPIQTGAALAASQRAMAMGGAVKGYAGGGTVDDDVDDTDIPGGSLSAMDPRFMGLIRQMMADSGKPTDEDKGLALAQAGFGMAASQSPRPLQAFGEGAGIGLQALQKLRQERAVQAMRAAQIGSAFQQHQENLQTKRDIAKQVSQDRQDAIQQRADAALQRSQDMQNSAADRALAREQLNDYRMQLLDLRRGQGGANLPDGVGEAFLSQLPESDQSVVKKVAAGEIDPRTLTQRDGYRNRIIAATAQYDPNYDQSNVGARFQLKKDFASGKSAQNITSANTLIGHLNALSDSAEKLNNWGFTPANTVANYISEKTGDPRIKQFQLNRQAVADELERLFRGTGGTLTAIQEWKHTLDSASSPEQFKGAIKAAVDLMDSRVGSLADMYNRGFGTQKTSLDFLSPKSRAVLAKISPDAYTQTAAVAAPGAPAPTPGMPAPAAGKIKVSNGKETLLIDPADAEAAKAEGYNPL